MSRPILAFTSSAFLAPALLVAQEAAHAAPARAPTTDPVSQVIVGVVVIGLFLLLTMEAAHRVLVAMLAVALLLVITYATPYHLMTFEGIREALDINVLMLLAAMMAVVGVLKTTGVFEWGVERVVARAGGRPGTLLALLLVFTAATSAFLDNVTTVVFVTPMALAVARRTKVSPHAFLLPMIMASNIGGTATLIGDPPNIMIGSGAGLSFLDFLRDLTLPCVAMVFWLEFYSRRYFGEAYKFKGPGSETLPPPAELANPGLARWLGAICVGILAGFLTHHLTGMPPAVPALVGAAAALLVQDVRYVRRERPSAHERQHGILAVTERDIEWPTLAFFGFLFIVVGAAVNTGLITTMARGLQWAIVSGGAALGLGPEGTLLLAALLVCWVSGAMSAVIDNIPFVAVAIPVIAGILPSMPEGGEVLWWALSLGACLGGNATPIGASANVTTIGLAERDGVRLPFREFVHYAVPMTAGTLVIASIYLASHVYLGRGGSFAAMAAAVLVLAVVRAASGRVRREPIPAMP